MKGKSAQMRDEKKTLDKKVDSFKLRKIVKKQKLKERGITLIALVVTIIILLILAGVTLNIALSDNGLFKKAQESADKYKEASEEEQTELLKSEYEFEKLQGNIDETVPIGQYSIEKQIKEKYGQDIKLGDTVNYEDNVEGYDGTWKVLGIENGQVLLMSSEPVKKNFELEGREGYLHLEEKLDGECKKFGNGEEAESARSLRVEDINRITGYNPNNPEKLSKHAQGTVGEYGSTVTFTLEDGCVKYECSNGISEKTTLTSFEHVDGRVLGQIGNSSISVKNGSYIYSYSPYEFKSGTKDVSLHVDLSDGLKSLFEYRNVDSYNFWLANKHVVANSNPVEKDNEFAAFFQVFRFEMMSTTTASAGFLVAGWRLFTSDGVETEHKANVMSVVTLKRDVKFKRDESKDWSLEEM